MRAILSPEPDKGKRLNLTDGSFLQLSSNRSPHPAEAKATLPCWSTLRVCNISLTQIHCQHAAHSINRLTILLYSRHWQLRSQIGTSTDSRYIFFLAGTANTQIHKLDTVTHQSEVIKFLSFQPRCLVAKNGWISAGGENGECVAFRVDESSSERPEPTPPESATTDPALIDPSITALHNYFENGGPPSIDTLLDTLRSGGYSVGPWLPPDHPDGRTQLTLETASDETESDIPDPIADDESDSMPDLMPADGDSDDLAGTIPQLTPTTVPMRRVPLRNPPPAVHTTNKNLVARSKCFGTERINCITLWFPPTSTIRKHSGAYSQSVAVLANNDKHVTVVGLESEEAVDRVTYPDYVNRALISPDGQLLVAICDDPYLYIHERVPKKIGGSIFTRRDLADFEWKPCTKIHLKSQSRDDTSDQRGSFAACFSNTGRYLAVGTQYGTISIFETATFHEPGLDALITSFTTSRPKEDLGAVRDMAFCPGPFDLLAWTEHRGRAGVADIRNNYVSRQILDLNKYDEYDQIMVHEKGFIDPRHLHRNEDGVLALSTDDANAARRLARRPTSERPSADATAAAVRDPHPPLAAEETMVLEALSAHRRRRDQLNAEGAVRHSDRLPGTRTLLDRVTNPNRGARGSGFHLSMGDSNRDHLTDLDRARAQTDRLRDTTERVRARRVLDSARALSNNPGSSDTNLTTTAERAASVAAALRTLRTLDPGNVSLDIFPGIGCAGRRALNNRADFVNTSQHLDMVGGADRYLLHERDGTEPVRDRDYLASVWSTILRSRGENATEPGTTTNARDTTRAARRLAARVAMNVNRHDDHERDNTAGLAWSEDGRVL